LTIRWTKPPGCPRRTAPRVLMLPDSNASSRARWDVAGGLTEGQGLSPARKPRLLSAFAWRRAWRIYGERTSWAPQELHSQVVRRRRGRS
jgi:hypothetical protein